MTSLRHLHGHVRHLHAARTRLATHGTTSTSSARSRRCFATISQELRADDARKKIHEEPPLNIYKTAEGFLDTWLRDLRNNNLVAPGEAGSAARAERWNAKPVASRKPEDPHFAAEDIVKQWPGYPRELVDFVHYLPTEVDRLCKRGEVTVLDVRHEWEQIIVPPIAGPSVYRLPAESFLDLAGEFRWGTGHVDIEKLLPEEIRARDTKFVVVSMDGTVGEQVAALLYGFGWDNASVMLDGMKGWTRDVNTELTAYDASDNPIEWIKQASDVPSEQIDPIEALSGNAKPVGRTAALENELEMFLGTTIAEAEQVSDSQAASASSPLSSASPPTIAVRVAPESSTTGISRDVLDQRKKKYGKKPLSIRQKMQNFFDSIDRGHLAQAGIDSPTGFTILGGIHDKSAR